MIELESYPKPPIIEAIFEILVEFPRNIAPSDLEKLHSQILTQYPKIKPRNQFEARFEVRDEMPIKSETISLGIDGYLFWSQDNKQVVQYRMNGFSFSRLTPYQTWDVHFPEAMRLWEIYFNELRPHKILRTAVRFLNRIEIPELRFEMSKYLRCPPLVPEIEQISLTNFFSQVQFVFLENQIKSSLTQTMGTKTAPNSVPIILDLDIFSEEKYNPELDWIQQTFLRLRKAKNIIFEKIITEETKELFR